MQTPYKAPSNHLPVNNELFIAPFPHDCSIKAIIHSATYFSIPPTPSTSPMFHTPGQRRCLLSISLVFYPGTMINIYDASIKIKFGPYSLCSPSVLGYQFLSLEYDTSFLETFAHHLRTVPSLLNNTWYTYGYHDLFTAKGTSKRESNPAWGVLSSDASTLTLTTEGTLGTPPGIPSTVPVCILLEFEEPPPPVLTASITVSGRLEEKGSRIRSLFRHFRRYKVKFPSIAICPGPRLPVLEGDTGLPRRSSIPSRNSLSSSRWTEQASPTVAIADASRAGVKPSIEIISPRTTPFKVPDVAGRPTVSLPLPPQSTNIQVAIPQALCLSLSELQLLPVASRPAPTPTITLTDYSVKIVNKGKARQIDFAQVISKAELRDLVATSDFRPKDPVSLSATELRAQHMLLAAQSLVIRFLMEEADYEQPDLEVHGEGVLLRAMQDKLDTTLLMELGTSWAAIRMTINNIFSKARALKDIERQIEELDEPIVQKREIEEPTPFTETRIDDSPIEPLMSIRALPGNLLRRRGQQIRTVAARQRVRWAGDTIREEVEPLENYV